MTLKELLQKHCNDQIIIRDSYGLYMYHREFNRDSMSGLEYLDIFGDKVDSFQVFNYEPVCNRLNLGYSYVYIQAEEK